MRGVEVLTSILLLVHFAPPLAHCQEQPDLDALASKAAAEIRKAAEPGDAKILVIDFADTHTKANELGTVLADQFAVSLRKNTQGLVVIDRADYARATAKDILTPEARTDEQSARCYCRQLGADFAVEGVIDAGSDKVQLDIRVARLSDRKRLFDGAASLPLTPELRANLLRPATTAPVSSQGDKNTWINPAEPPGAGVAVTPRPPGSTKASPACIYCPTGGFSDAAVKAKVQGTVLLSIVVDVTGHPASISVVRGLPCGLNGQALEAAKLWKFKPAEDSDGNPVGVRQLAEVTFHLY